MNSDTLTLAIIGHLVGDFVLQNDFLAMNKKKSATVCAIHCTIWTLCVVGFAGWFDWLAVTILFVTHYFQDHTHAIERWMDLVGQWNFRTGPCAPWALIVVDNTFHILAIWFVWKFIV